MNIGSCRIMVRASQKYEFQRLDVILGRIEEEEVPFVRFSVGPMLMFNLS